MSKQDKEPIISVGEEKYIIEEFLRYLKEIEDKYGKVVLVGWKIKNFDIPFVIMRSLVCNIDEKLVKIFLGVKILDLAEVANKYLTINTQIPSSREFCEAFGIEYDKEITGADIPSLYKIGRIDRIVEHCRIDLFVIRELYKRLFPLLKFIMD